MHEKSGQLNLFLNFHPAGFLERESGLIGKGL